MESNPRPLTYRPMRTTLLVAVTMLATQLGAAEDGLRTMEDMTVIGVTPIHGVGLPEKQVPYAVQSATGADLRRTQSLDLTDFLNRNLGGVTINSAQNNPLQPDVQYRGFAASPLLGLPQGLAVYQNGVRVLEPFGDTINWELLPAAAIGSINLIGGANPLFGLNTLGGSLSIQTNNGFTHEGHRAEVSGGSFGRVAGHVDSGWNNGTFGYFATFNYFDEDGFREQSDSDVQNFFGSVGWRGEDSDLDLSFTYGDSELRGNGPLPVQLLNMDTETFFTAPDITENDLKMVIAEGSHWFNDVALIAANAFYRDIQTDSFNGDGTEFEKCMLAVNAGLLCEEGAGGMEEVVTDQFGVGLGDANDAINNISTRDQRAYGGTAQQSFLSDVLARENQLIVGASWTQGLADFESQVEVSRLNPDRTTTRSGRFVPDGDTRIDTRTRTWSLFFTDTFSVTPDLALTLSGRFNSTRVVIRDRSGTAPELNGDHNFDRFNPAGGIAWQAHPLMNVYASYSESARAPTAVELVCADADAPCNLPNAFLADPPLEQVVAESVEAGIRGELPEFESLDIGTVNWSVSGFHTVNKDDIVFQSTGGITANEGFFDNIGDTRRIGAEVGLDGNYGPVDWFLNYSLVNATFRDAFMVNSPNHPMATAAGTISVGKGDSIPGIPRHAVKFGMDVAITPALSMGGDLLYNAGQYLRGDEGNLLESTDGYTVLNLRGEYSVNDNLAIFAKVENLLDKDFETFGLLGAPGEVLGPAFTDPRFLSPGAGRGGWIGVRVDL